MVRLLLCLVSLVERATEALRFTLCSRGSLEVVVATASLCGGRGSVLFVSVIFLIGYWKVLLTVFSPGS